MIDYKAQQKPSQDKLLDGGIPINQDFRHGKQLQPTSQKYLEEKNLTNQSQIPMFIQGKDPKDHIRTCEKEWKRLGYKDERTWPTTKFSRNLHRISCQMAEYPLIKIADMDNSFNLLYRNIWTKNVNQSSPNTYIYPRT